MSATALAAIVAIVVGYASGITATLVYLGGRIDRLGERIGSLEVEAARIGQWLDDHTMLTDSLMRDRRDSDR